MGKRERKRLKLFAKQLHQISSQLNIGTTTLTPLNYSQEKEKFFASDTYNPQFFYHKRNITSLKHTIAELSESIHHLHIPSDLKDYLSQIIDELHSEVDMIDAIGTEKFASYAYSLFHFQDIDTTSFLKDMPSLNFYEPDVMQLHTAQDMHKIFQEYIEQLNVDFKIEIDHFNDHIVRVGRKKLIIGARVKRFCNNVERLIVHEIESHMLQKYNMENAQNPLLRITRHGENLLWGEGMAVYNEITAKKITRSAYETYYYRLKAVSMIHKSFREIYNYLSNHVSDEKAFMITYRVKRGMGDTARPGGYPKDASYLAGYKKVQEYLENGGNLEFLYISRVPAIGELLLENDLLEVSTIQLPKHLQSSNKQNSIPFVSQYDVLTS